MASVQMPAAVAQHPQMVMAANMSGQQLQEVYAVCFPLSRIMTYQCDSVMASS